MCVSVVRPLDVWCALYSCFFFFNDPATTEIYTLSLHDALPISSPRILVVVVLALSLLTAMMPAASAGKLPTRSEEHTSELQSLRHLVCRLLLEKKKKRLDRGSGPSTNRTYYISDERITST